MQNRKLTLQWLEKNNACQRGVEYYKTLNSTDLAYCLQRAVADGRFGDCLWVIRRKMSRKQLLAFAIYCAEQVAHLNPDPWVQAAIDAAKAVLKRDTKANRGAAADAARAAADAARAAADAAADAAYADADAARAAADADADAAYADAYAARAAARAARAAADAAYAAADAADAAAYAARAAADAAAREEMQKRIVNYSVEVLCKISS